MARHLEVSRTTKETDIFASLTLPESSRDRGAARDQSPSGGGIAVDTGIPFFDHMLQAFLFHGGFAGEIRARGDLEIDDHHTVEDTGIVLGTLFARVPGEFGPIERFGHSLVPMDDALGEVVVDACGRSYLEYQVSFPQPYAGRFDLALVREFFTGFAQNARINLHIIGRYGLNGHHLAEALFKATGRALGEAYLPSGVVRSTKGVL
ncbi:hypothetical protein AU468_12995 [Alkalispirochaeta sphaeroplastigenens]|uniref:Imidazoleglycerol-phosphate dehydratase n=1 Tax=Alkalispirochaeta sphaeroplastigenens TaxID=1187066 RepID=A0A2S4JG60_9SPIO|nr:imidazoleglycerol-phosphate dehydratase [Alkalispirochaeta sphaeroplastigenens]POQ98503.1 hypothetical protein AU468_12995 [Alkalispirochaeta sphaeroplastigenens]